jgi:hypothetical protein
MVFRIEINCLGVSCDSFVEFLRLQMLIAFLFKCSSAHPCYTNQRTIKDLDYWRKLLLQNFFSRRKGEQGNNASTNAYC